MIPILFNSNETDFTKNGIGRLFPISCLVGEERNGAYEMELVINEESKYFSQIELGSLIGAQVSDGSMQLFRVYSIEKSLDEVSVKCQHISYDLSYIPVSPFVALSPSEAMSKISQYSVVPNPFTFITDKVSDVRFEQLTPKSVRAILGGEENSLLDVYGGGEYKFDNRIVTLYAARGEDKGITIRYGKNLTELNDTETNENAIDGLLPYWTDGSIAVTGNIVRTNMGNKIIAEDISGDITLEEGETQPTVAQVNVAGANHLRDKIVSTEESIKVSLYENNSISDVALCDTVNVIYEPYNINVKMKVVKTIWNVVEEHYESVELGEYKSLAKTLSSMSNQIDNINYNNGITHIRLEKVEDGIEAEVTRATSEEERLSGQIDIKAGEVVQQVSATVKTWDTSSYSISVYGIGSPYTQGVEADEHYHEYYLDNASGELWYSNGSYWYHVAYLTSVVTTIEGKLETKIDEDDDGTIISLINGSANIINFNALNMFTVNAPNFTVTHDGTIKSNNATLRGTTTYEVYEYNSSTHEYEYNEIGKFGLTPVGNDTGIGLRNSTGTGAVVMGRSTGNVWLEGGGKVIYLGAYGFVPWNADLQLGQDGKRWTKLYCDYISCTHEPWSTSDKRLKDVKGTIKKAVDFYMSLNPIQYTFKDGVAFENPENMHYGLIAQDVLNSYEKCYNTDKQSIVKKEKVLEDSTKEVLDGDEEKYSINYNELHAFHIAMIQDLAEEVKALKDENSRLSAKIDEIERRLK